jgi:uncharacterized protein (TIGR02147 family)
VSKQKRPDIFSYHDYRKFLRDWVDYQRSVRPGYSLRKLSQEAGLATGHLPPILAGKRDVTLRTLAKLMLVMKLAPPEKSYLDSLVRLCTSDSQELRAEALERMKRYTSYQKHNPNEAQLFRYMSRWYHIAIREMAALPGFRMDAAWIQQRLSSPVSLAQIRDALEFLVEGGYLKVSSDGKATSTDEHLDCDNGEVFRAALTQYHKQMFGLAAASIDNAHPDHRNLVGHTFVVDDATFPAVNRIVEDALSKIIELSGRSKAKGEGSVYHVEMALFPVTHRKGPKE